MKHISLGGLDVSRIGLGTMAMSGYYLDPTSSDAESIRTIHRALELGVTHIDTAEIYGPYANEELVGRALEGPPRRRRGGDEVRLRLALGGGPGVLDSSPANIRTAVEGSLKRLDTDRIDLYYQHRVDPNTPIEDTVGALAELVAEGKVLHIGLSEAGPDDDPSRPRRAPGRRAADRVLALDTRPGGRAAPAAARAGHRLRALLAARPRLPHRHDPLPRRARRRRLAQDTTRASPRATSSRTSASSTRSRPSPSEVGATPAQVALAWLLAQGDDIAPIPGTKRVSRVEENTAADGVELSDEQIGRLNDLTPATGERHDTANMASIDG